MGLFSRKTLKEHDIPFNQIDNDIHALVFHTALDGNNHIVSMIVDEDDIGFFHVGKKIRISKTNSLGEPVANTPSQPVPIAQPQMPQQNDNPMPQPVQPVIDPVVQDLMQEHNVQIPKKPDIWIPKDLEQRVEAFVKAGIKDPIYISKGIFGEQYYDEQMIAVIDELKAYSEEDERKADESVSEATLTEENVPHNENLQTESEKTFFKKYEEKMRMQGKIRKRCTVCGKRRYGNANQVNFICDKCAEDEDENS